MQWLSGRQSRHIDESCVRGSSQAPSDSPNVYTIWNLIETEKIEFQYEMKSSHFLCPWHYVSPHNDLMFAAARVSVLISSLVSLSLRGRDVVLLFFFSEKKLRMRIEEGKKMGKNEERRSVYMARL